MMLEGFMEPWCIGKTVEEAKASIKDCASMGFGLSQGAASDDQTEPIVLVFVAKTVTLFWRISQYRP